MPEFSVNSYRYDPYKSFNFRIKWDGQYVAGLSKMGALARTTEPVIHRNGGDPVHERKSPGKTKYNAVTFERGVTHDLAFEAWAELVHTPDATISLRNFRKDLTVEDALRLLDALRGEQRGLPAILEGTGVRQGGNVDVPY